MTPCFTSHCKALSFFTRTFAVVCIIALWLCSNTTVTAAEPLRLRVLSYNIHHAEGMDRKLDVPRIAEVIRSVQPDLVAVQEVDKLVQRTQNVDQPAELARLTQMHVVFGANIKLQGGHYGNAVLSKYPVAQHTNHLLPSLDDGEQRGVIEALITVPDLQTPLRLYATHLDYRADEAERLASADMINKLIAGFPAQPALLAGDLNATPKSQTLKRFDAVWTKVNPQPLPTIPVAKPNRQIDFILYRPQDRWKVIEVKVLDEAIASDHRAIFAILELLPGKDD